MNPNWTLRAGCCLPSSRPVRPVAGRVSLSEPVRRGVGVEGAAVDAQVLVRAGDLVRARNKATYTGTHERRAMGGGLPGRAVPRSFVLMVGQPPIQPPSNFKA